MISIYLHEPEVRCSSTLYPGTHQTSQREPHTEPAQSNRGASHSGERAADPTTAGNVRLSGDGNPRHDSSRPIRRDQ